jgi:hypothetical protein
MSEIITDTITGKSTATTITIGSTPVVSASANSMTIRGEGTAQTSIQQGLAKAWTFCTDNVITDSLNTSSSSDETTGSYIITLSNNTTTANVAGNISCNENINLIGHRSSNSTSTYQIRLKDTSGNAVDANSGATLHGDLA